MICFYYAITAFACAWYFRRALRRSARDLLFKGVFPVLGGVLLTAVFTKTLIDMWNPAYGSGSSVLASARSSSSASDCSCSASSSCW